MKKLKVSPDQIARAKLLFDFKALNNSITSGEGNLAGALGEILIADRYKVLNEFNTYDYDLVIKDKTVDVKTKRYKRNRSANSKVNLNVAAFNTIQKCDYYCFVGVSYDLQEAFLYGFIKKDDFYHKAVFHRAGEVDPNGDGIWRFRCNCYNILPKDLE